MINFRSIPVRLILWYTALVVVLAAGFGGYTYYNLQRQLYGELNEMLSHRVEHLANNILTEMPADTKALAREIQDVYSPEENDRFIRISRAGGAILYVSGAPLDKSFDPSRIPAPVNYTDDVSERMETLRASQKFMLVGLTKELDGKRYVIEIGASTRELDRALRKLILTLATSLPFVIALAALGGWFLIQRSLRPVEVIRSTAEKITFSDSRQRLPVSRTGDAIELLTHTLNQMLERLDQAYQQASRFSADASHELRTPLTIMRSELESIIKTEQSPLRERIGSVLEEAERLSGIVEGLFSIARLDAGEAKTDLVRFDLAALARSTIDQMLLLAEEKQISVRVEAIASVFVVGDVARIKQVLVNLLDNAIKYTMPGGSILLRACARQSRAVLTVQDNGMGIPAEALPHVFERFYRADKARSRSHQGAGLGLSLVSAICQAHGGHIDIQSTEGTGTTVTVDLSLVS